MIVFIIKFLREASSFQGFLNDKIVSNNRTKIAFSVQTPKGLFKIIRFELVKINKVVNVSLKINQ